MKKIFISALSLSILLAGCGHEKQDNKGITKIDESEEKVKYISDEKLKKDVQNFIDKITTDFENIIMASEGGGMSDDIPGNMKFSVEQMSNTQKEIDKYIQKNNLKPKDKVNLEHISNGVSMITTMFDEMIVEMKKALNGEITEEEFQEKLKDIENNEKYTEGGEKVDKALEYFENKGVNTKKLLNLFEEDSSISENQEDNQASTEDDPDGDGYSSDLVDTFKVNKSIEVGPATFTITKVETATEPVTEDNSYDFEGYKVGDEAQMIIVYMKLKNNTDQNADYYPDQDEIVTDTGEQVAPASFNLDTGLVTEMKGAVESEGRVVYLLKNSNVKDIKNITFIAGAYLDPETMDEITPEQKIEIPLEK